MVIDDSSTIFRSADLFLKNENYEVVGAVDGFDALSKIEEENPDLVFLDVLMPIIDGLETCQVIRGNPIFRDLPIIFLSSKEGELDKARGIMVGGDDYLVKPFSKEQIIEVVKKYTSHLLK
jgi:twitching motility two-component system response regulator PilG